MLVVMSDVREFICGDSPRSGVILLLVGGFVGGSGGIFVAWVME